VTKLFLPQTTLEEWALDDKADIKEGKLVVTEEKDSSYPVTPAVHFLRLVSGNDDKKLVAKVKTQEQLQGWGAELFGDSVILGETAYEVAPGYLAEVPTPKSETKPDPKKKASPEADLLAAFILDKLS
jgi:hypothetical protein